MHGSAISLLTWNLCHGGGSRRMAPIMLRLLAHSADVILLTEFRRSIGGQLAGILADHGWSHQVSTDPPRSCNGLLLASRTPVRAGPSGDPRHIEADLPELGIGLSGIHVPCGASNSPVREGRAGFWRSVIATAARRADGHFVVMGDFNTGRHHADEAGATFRATRYLDQLEALGYQDAWRSRNPQAREYSWFSHDGSGFRIDHAYVSKPLAERIRGAFYSHSEREEGLSDHSALVVCVAA